jgi:hypothetical protein
VLGIFSYLVNDYAKIFMDEFTPYSNDFDKDLENLENVLKCCKQTHLSLSIGKCHLMMNDEVDLGHYITYDGIQVDLAKIEVILKIPPPKTQK